MDQPSDTTSGTTPVTLAMYRDLRVGMVVTLLMLATAIVVERTMASRLQLALSEYYFTSAHSIFIAALLGIATLFFVYRGSSDTEDALLTLAGVAALIAALVPQGRPDTYGRHSLPKDYDFTAVVLPNVWAVVVALALGWGLSYWQHRYNKTRQTRSPGGTLALYFLRLVVALGLITLIFFRKTFNDYAHGAAGVLMLTAFIATVFSSAYLAGQVETPPNRRSYKWFYRIIAWVMLATLIGVLTLHLASSGWLRDIWILVLETALILEFTAYWVVQTIDLWVTPDIRGCLPEAERNRLPGERAPGMKGLKAEFAKAWHAPAGKKLLSLL